MARRQTLPNLENCTLAELQTAVKAAPTKRSIVRLIAIEELLFGMEFSKVAELHQVTDRTLRSWVRAFNRFGIDGLIEKARPGRPRIIDKQQAQHCKEMLENPELAGQIHWTAKKFHGYLRQELDLEIGYRTVVRWLHENNFKLKVPQPWPNHQDEAARQRFLEQLRQLLDDEQIDLWYMDETGIEGDPRPRRRWIEVGKNGRVPYEGQHIRMNVSGMVCPRTGIFYALEFSHTDSEIFQIFLDHANFDLRFERPRNILILDNASWHKRKSTNWGRFEPFFLPPYSPDFNPIERLWLLIKAEWFADFVAKDLQHLIDRIDQALRWVIDRKTDNCHTCSIRK